MNKIKSLSLHMTFALIIFYLIPLVLRFLIDEDGAWGGMLYGFLTLILIPGLSISLLSFLNGRRLGLNLFLPFVYALFFIPAIYIFYNNSAYVYLPIYFILSLMAVIFGYRVKEGKSIVTTEVSGE